VFDYNKSKRVSQEIRSDFVVQGGQVGKQRRIRESVFIAKKVVSGFIVIFPFSTQKILFFYLLYQPLI
jgi:uncharacterized membrane protein